MGILDGMGGAPCGCDGGGGTPEPVPLITGAVDVKGDVVLGSVLPTPDDGKMGSTGSLDPYKICTAIFGSMILITT